MVAPQKAWSSLRCIHKNPFVDSPYRCNSKAKGCQKQEWTRNIPSKFSPFQSVKQIMSWCHNSVLGFLILHLLKDNWEPNVFCNWDGERKTSLSCTLGCIWGWKLLGCNSLVTLIFMKFLCAAITPSNPCWGWGCCPPCPALPLHQLFPSLEKQGRNLLLVKYKCLFL